MTGVRPGAHQAPVVDVMQRYTVQHAQHLNSRCLSYFFASKLLCASSISSQTPVKASIQSCCPPGRFSPSRSPLHLVCRNSNVHTSSVLVDSRDAPLTWAGLQAWRTSSVDLRRGWGSSGGPTEQIPAPGADNAEGIALPDSLAECGCLVLQTADPMLKAGLTHRAWKLYKHGGMPIGVAAAPDRPARPNLPKLVPQKQVPPPKKSNLPLNAYMLHNLAHIELNAIDLAWDTVVRFSSYGLQQGFYADFARVADDEARHLGWCLQRLAEIGHSYGDMVAHNLLWEGAEVSSGDLVSRLAVVPMSQEARGLDAGPRLVQKLRGWADNRSADIVHRISEEERAHVAVGVAWFRSVSAALGAEAGRTFREQMTLLCPDLVKGPFNHEARKAVGLQRDWYDMELWLPEEQDKVVHAQEQRKIRLEQQNVTAECGRDMGSGVPRTSGPSAEAGPTVPQLQLLRSRLEGMVQMEASTI